MKDKYPQNLSFMEITRIRLEDLTRVLPSEYSRRPSLSEVAERAIEEAHAKYVGKKKK